jgi:hypothetical protein
VRRHQRPPALSDPGASQVVSSCAATSPPHAAELLDALVPYLTALTLPLPLPATPAAAAAAAGGATPAGLLAAAEAREPFSVAVVRVAHQLLVS